MQIRVYARSAKIRCVSLRNVGDATCNCKLNIVAVLSFRITTRECSSLANNFFPIYHSHKDLFHQNTITT
jgi:hypothetical protein